MDKNVISLDRAHLKKSALTEVEGLLKKLERLESSIETFYETDLKLFEEWYERTFQRRLKAIRELQEKYQRFSQIYNWIVAIAEERNLSIPEAYKVYQEEEKRYKNGSPDERRLIEEERARRDELDLLSGLEFDDEREESLPLRTEEEEESFLKISQLSDAELREILKDELGGTLLLTEVGELVRAPKDYEVFLRIWDLAPDKLQKEFRKFFAKHNSELSLDTILETMRSELADWRELEAEEDAEEELVPDQKELEAREKLAALKARDLNSLSLVELRESQALLEEEIRHVEEFIEELKESPAWGFSHKRNYKALKEEIELDLDWEYWELLGQCGAVSSQLDMLESEAKTMETPRKKRRTRSTRSRASKVRQTEAEA